MNRQWWGVMCLVNLFIGIGGWGAGYLEGKMQADHYYHRNWEPKSPRLTTDKGQQTLIWTIGKGEKKGDTDIFELQPEIIQAPDGQTIDGMSTFLVLRDGLWMELVFDGKKSWRTRNVQHTVPPCQTKDGRDDIWMECGELELDRLYILPDKK